MTASNPMSFDVIDDALRRAGAVTEPAEAHGSLCGLACVLGADAQASWLADTLATVEEPALPDEDNGEGPAGIDEAAALLGVLAAASTKALETGDMSFQPLLPSDDESLEQRTAALAAWCQGFNYGLALAAHFGDADEVVRHEAIAEIVRDFAELAQLGYKEDEGEGDVEADWAELIEYVRVSVQLVFEEMAGVRQRIVTTVRH